MTNVARLPAQAYVYVLGAVDSPQKIGISRDPYRRAGEFKTGSHQELVVSFKTPLLRSEAYEVERLVHHRLSERRVRGEWFDVTPEEAAREVEEGVAAYHRGERSPRSAGNPEMERVVMMAPASWLARITEWRARQDPIPSLSAAIRQLVVMGLEIEAERAKKPEPGTP